MAFEYFSRYFLIEVGKCWRRCSLRVQAQNSTIAAAFGIARGLLCWPFLLHFNLGGSDFNWAHYAARALLSGQKPHMPTLRLELFPVELTIPAPEVAALFSKGMAMAAADGVGPS
jgi:hypothetical protein